MQNLNVYLVGGAVRDSLLGLPIKERDWVVVGATEQQMISLGFIKVGKDFPVFLHPDTKEEYALARRERKIAKGYYGFTCDFSPDVTLEEDLLRRDLTINAMAQNSAGDIIDPYAGNADLNNRIFRHVSPSFNEDPLRILRLARFAARYKYLGFMVAAETTQLMRQIVDANEIDALVPERVWKEFVLALGEKNPESFIEVLRSCGALKVIFPALDMLWGIPQTREYHPEIDTGVHIMMALQQACKISTNTKVRFAVLCHDLGKGRTKEQDWPSHKGHEELGIDPILAWCNKYRVPNAYRELAIMTSKYHLNIHRVLELKPKTVLKILTNTDAWRKEDRFLNLLLACKADATGRLGSEDNPYPQEEYFKQAIKAVKVLNIPKLIQGETDAKILVEKIQHARLAVLTQFKQEYLNKGKFFV
jgi:tRNA nucleotidyltransferase (CCA-adding enzyme)